MISGVVLCMELFMLHSQVENYFRNKHLSMMLWVVSVCKLSMENKIENARSSVWIAFLSQVKLIATPINILHSNLFMYLPLNCVFMCYLLPIHSVLYVS